jgi:hypothetical protein
MAGRLSRRFDRFHLQADVVSVSGTEAAPQVTPGMDVSHHWKIFQ